MSRRLARAGLLTLLAVTTLTADVIVLKSGRRIQAWSVEVKGDHVWWETQAGRFGLPWRLVERIERDEAAPALPPLVENAAVVSLPTLDDAMVAQVIVNGRIDRELVARLENEASRGDTAAQRRAAAAHAAVGQFLYAQADLVGAIASVERALAFAPNHPVLLLNLATLYYLQRDFPHALDALERAARGDSYTFEVNRLKGLVYYEQEKLDAAIRAWKQALAVRPEGEVQNWLARAEREAGAAAGYGERGSGRFLLRYSGAVSGRQSGLVREVMQTLERDFDDLTHEFDYLPRGRIVVLLYTEKAFNDVTSAPSWVDAVHDGKIRVPIQGLTSVTRRLRRVLRHELTHAFVHEKSRGQAPRWLHEGLAEWFEGARTANYGEVMRQVVERGRLPITNLNALLSAGSYEEVATGYALALAVVESMIELYGMSGITRLLDELGRGASLEAAVRAGYRMDLAGLERRVLDSLRRRYVR